MSNQVTQADLDALADRLEAKATAERSEIALAIQELKSEISAGKPLDLSRLVALEDRIGGIFSKENPAPAGRLIVVKSASVGGETFDVEVKNGNISEPRAEFLRNLFDATTAAARAEPIKGAEFSSKLSINDSASGSDSVALTHESQKAASDVAALEILLDAARTQLAAVRAQ